jgi:outer membrane protein
MTMRMPRALLALFAGALVTPAPAAAARLLTLDEALRTAQANQPQLAAAHAQARAAAERAAAARAGYRPRLDAQAQYQRSTGNFILAPLMVNTPLTKGGYHARNELGFGDTLDYYVFGLTATQLISDFGKTTGAMAQADAAAEASRADAAAATLTVALNVRVAYYGALAAKELVAVGEDTVRNQTRHVEQIRHFVAVGARTRFDLSSAELNLANAELVVVRARNALALAKVRLNTAMGVDESTDFDVVAPPAAPTGEETERAGALAQTALHDRPEIWRADAQLRLQDAARRTARAGYLPSLSLLGNLSYGKVGGYGGSADWYVGVGLSWNLFNGFLTRHQVREAEANLAAATAQRESLRQTIRADVEEQLLAITEAQRREEVAARAEATARERLQLAEDRYRTGAGDVLDLDDAQVGYAGAQAQRVQARYDLAVARARLARAVGRRTSMTDGGER